MARTSDARGAAKVSLDGMLAAFPPRALARVIELLAEGVVLVCGEEVVYRNAAAVRLIAVEGDALAREVRTLARRALHIPAAAAPREFATMVTRYSLRASVLAADTNSGNDPVVLVTLNRASPTLPCRATLARQFGLTGREAAVALLLAEGLRNDVIAQTLNIKESTAHHHTESVFTKLGVHSRGAAAAALLGAVRTTTDAPEPEMTHSTQAAKHVTRGFRERRR